MRIIIIIIFFFFFFFFSSNLNHTFQTKKKNRYPWLPDTRKAANERSVTELEVMHGALNDVSNAGHALFYMLHEELCDASKSDNATRLKALKERIRDSNLPVRIYSTPQEVSGDSLLLLLLFHCN